MVLMSITMRFGSSRIHDLDAQTTKEQFVNSYQQFISRVLGTNYYNEQRYTGVSLDFSSGSRGLFAVYDGFDSGIILFDSDRIVLDSFSLGKTPVERLFLQFVPYQIWCSMKSKEAIGSGMSFRMRINNDKQYCFVIQSPLCKIEQATCPF